MPTAKSRARAKLAASRETNDAQPKKTTRTRRTKDECVRDGAARLIADPKQPPTAMTPEMQRHFDELARPSAVEMDCTVCGQGKGVPKVQGPDMRCCVVCWGMLAEMLPTKRLAILTLVAEGRLNREKWMEFRLEPFGRWLMSEGRMRVQPSVVDNIA